MNKLTIKEVVTNESVQKRIHEDIEARYMAEVIFYNSVVKEYSNEYGNGRVSCGRIDDGGIYEEVYEVVDNTYSVQVREDYYGDMGVDYWRVDVAIDPDDQEDVRFHVREEIKNATIELCKECRERSVGKLMYAYVQSLLSVANQKPKLKELKLLNKDGSLRKDTGMYEKMFDTDGNYIGGH